MSFEQNSLLNDSNDEFHSINLRDSEFWEIDRKKKAGPRKSPGEPRSPTSVTSNGFSPPNALTPQQELLHQTVADCNRLVSQHGLFDKTLRGRIDDARGQLSIEEKKNPVHKQNLWNCRCHLESLEIHRKEFANTLEVAGHFLRVVDANAPDDDTATAKIQLIHTVMYMINKHFTTANYLTKQRQERWTEIYSGWNDVIRAYRTSEKQFQLWRVENPKWAKVLDISVTAGATLGVAGGIGIGCWSMFVALNQWHPVGWVLAGVSLGAGVFYWIFRSRPKNSEYWDQISKIRSYLHAEELRSLRDSLNGACDTFLGFWERQFPTVVPALPHLLHLRHDTDVCGVCSEKLHPTVGLQTHLWGVSSCKHVFHQQCLNGDLTREFCPQCQVQFGSKVNIYNN